MSKDDAPEMPGLLYEAQLPENATRPGGQRNRGAPSETRTNTQQNTDSSNNRSTDGNDSDTVRNSETRTDTQQNIDSSNNRTADAIQDDACRENSLEDNDVPETSQENCVTDVPMSTTHQSRQSNHQHEGSEGAASSQQRSDHHVQSERNATALPSPLEGLASPTISLPLAIAKIYKLPVVSGSAGTSIALDTSSQTAYLHQDLSAAELQSNVEARLPRNGGKIETTRDKRGKLRYVIYNRDGEIKRTLFVDENGKVMEVTLREDDGVPDPADNTIKLGLGDFIFYSVLVSKAAQNGFAPFVACFLSIVAGLGGTLVLLAVYHHALPALPISIFLAVTMFVATIYCIEPWIHSLWRAGPFYF